MLVCVTGGAGFIGSHVAEAFIADGHRVIILDDLSTGSLENVPDKAEFHKLDIRSPEAAQLMDREGVELLVHHAAQINVRRSTKDPAFDADVNIIGTINLMEAGRRSKLRQVIFASTGGAMYGDEGPFPATEDQKPWPVSPYGVSKLAVEHYLYFYYREYGISATCLRYANVYGPRQNPHGEAGVVAIFLDRMLTGKNPVINGDGKQTRDYVWVGDVVQANLACLGLNGFRIYNVGTGVETDVNTLYSMLRDALGGGPDAVHGPPKPGEQRRSSVSSRLMEVELGVSPATPLAEGLKKTAEWFRARYRGRERNESAGGTG